jgi:hypothetical protein
MLSIGWSTGVAELDNTPRHLTLKGAYIVFNDRRSTISCVIKNLSDSGAKLQVPSALGIPNTLRQVLTDKTERPCWVVRRTEKEIGVAFTDWVPPAETFGP